MHYAHDVDYAALVKSMILMRAPTKVITLSPGHAHTKQEQESPSLSHYTLQAVGMSYH